MYSFVDSHLILVNRLIYVHLCKQASNNNIMFEFFPQIISCICKTSILTSILICPFILTLPDLSLLLPRTLSNGGGGGSVDPH